MSDSKPDIQVFNQSVCTIPIEDSIYPKIAATIADEEQSSINFVEVVYVDEDEIVRVNNEHLDRDYVTDIITFRYDDASTKKDIEGTMFCCAPRIIEQAEEFNESIEQEFLRIYIHGLLHLIGYKDKSEKQKQQMTAKEDTYLNLASTL